MLSLVATIHHTWSDTPLFWNETVTFEYVKIFFLRKETVSLLLIWNRPLTCINDLLLGRNAQLRKILLATGRAWRSSWTWSISVFFLSISYACVGRPYIDYIIHNKHEWIGFVISCWFDEKDFEALGSSTIRYLTCNDSQIRSSLAPVGWSLKLSFDKVQKEYYIYFSRFLFCFWWF